MRTTLTKLMFALFAVMVGTRLELLFSRCDRVDRVDDVTFEITV